MTLVAAFMISDQPHPYLVGDFLISSPAPSGSPLSLPTGEQFTFETSFIGQPVPTGLRQKVTVLSDHLAVGWSGSMIYARSLIREISEEFSDRQVSGDEVVAFLKGKEKEYSNVSLVGISRSDDTVHVFFFNGALGISHPVIKNFFAIGSASSVFADYSRSCPISSGDHIDITLSVVGMLGALLGEELRVQSTLLNYFGGGFEVIFYNGKQFKKIDEITYIFWSAHEHADRKLYLMGLPVFIKYKAAGDLCVVRRSSGEMEDCSEHKVPDITTELFRIEPVLRTPTEDEWSVVGVPSLNSNLQCHYIFGHLQDGNHILLPAVDFGSQGFKFEEKGQDLLISPSDDFIKKITDNIEEAVRNHYQK